MRLLREPNGLSVLTATNRLFFFSTDPRFRSHIHPLNAPGTDCPMTRCRPADHPWQYGVFVGLNKVNGLDFWRSGDAYYEPAIRGTMRNRELTNLCESNGEVSFCAVNDWTGPDGAPVLEERQHIRVPQQDTHHSYVLDWDWELCARHGDVTVGASAYGGLSVRLVGNSSTRRHLNSEHLTGDQCAEATARWCCVAQPVDGVGVFSAATRQTHAYAGVAIIEHPTNAGHPNRWRVDGDGMINPCRALAGPWHIARGESARAALPALRFPRLAGPRGDRDRLPSLDSMKPRVLILDDGLLAKDWPYTGPRLEERLRDTCNLRWLPPAETATFDWSTVRAVALFAGDLNDVILAQARQLQVVGGITDAHGPACFAQLVARHIPFVDATRAWAPSVAECGFALALNALRQIPHWHHRLIARGFDWQFPHGQFCDDPRFVNGDLGAKTVGVLGLGQIGSRLAAWSHHLGARVLAHDPFAPPDRFAAAHAVPATLDQLATEAEVLFIAVPPTPSARRLFSAAHIHRLRRGAIVVTVTRTAALDTAALRARVLADELVWAADVFDREPLPADDPLVGRANVVHTPHIAGRTRDANRRLADCLADDFLRVLAGQPPVAALTPRAVSIRTQAQPV